MMDQSPMSLAVFLPPPALEGDELQGVIDRLTPAQVLFLRWLPRCGDLVETTGPDMRVMIRILWLSGLRLVEVRGPVGNGELVRLSKAGRAVASVLHRTAACERRGDDG